MTLRSFLRSVFAGSGTAPDVRAPLAELVLPRPEGPRHALVAASAAAGQAPRPLVILLHGAGASARQLMGLAFPPSPLSVWREIAQREQLVVIAADAGPGGWSDCFADARAVARKDDVAFVGALIDRAVADLGADPERVFVVGVSRGGFLAYRAASEIGPRLAGFAAVLACMPPAGRLPAPTHPLSALVFGATADPLMPYRGGKQWRTLGFMQPVASIDDSVRAWRELAGLPDTPRVDAVPHRPGSDRTRVTRSLWDGPGPLQVGLYRIDGGGHAEPSASQRYPRFINALVGAQNGDVETAEAAWAFFEGKRRTPAAPEHAHSGGAPLPGAVGEGAG